MTAAEIINASCMDPDRGCLAWLSEGAPYVVVTDPPYAGVSSYSTTSRGFGAGRFRDVENRRGDLGYGELTEDLRRGIARICAGAIRCAIFCKPEDLGAWKAAIERVGLAWGGSGILCQRQGTPRIDGLSVSVRTLGLAIGRARRRIAWDGRDWAEWHELREKRSTPFERPIAGTRSTAVMRNIVRDFAGSCGAVRPIVIDPCAGTGTTVVAARLEGYDAAGWEVNPDTADWADRRVRGLPVKSCTGQIEMNWDPAP